MGWLPCRNCGDVVAPERVELGYDYCLKEECQRRCMEPVLLAAVGVNKAADYYTRADEVLPLPGPARRAATGDDDAGEAPRRRARSPRRKRAPSTLDRLQAEEVALDAALAQNYQRFSRGEITAKEMDRRRLHLIGAFNQLVRSENIRYRSMLRSQARPIR